MNDSEYYSFEDRLYENPTTSRDEQMSFVDNLRAAQQAANAQIKTQTENLGTQIPSVKGGLTGPEGYFQSRYQTAPTNAIVGDLRAAAQADALNKVLSNYSEQMQKKYNDAYRQYQKNRARRAASGGGGGTYGGGGGTTSGTPSDTTIGEIETIASDAALPATSSISSAPQNGWSDTSYTDLEGRVHRVYTNEAGERVEYIGNDRVFDNRKSTAASVLPSWVDVDTFYDEANKAVSTYDTFRSRLPSWVSESDAQRMYAKLTGPTTGGGD